MALVRLLWPQDTAAHALAAAPWVPGIAGAGEAGSESSSSSKPASSGTNVSSSKAKGGDLERVDGKTIDLCQPPLAPSQATSAAAAGAGRAVRGLHPGSLNGAEAALGGLLRQGVLRQAVLLLSEFNDVLAK